MNEQTGELRRQAVNLEIENANLFSWIYILSLFYDIFLNKKVQVFVFFYHAEA